MQRSSTKRRISSHAPIAAIELNQSSKGSDGNRASLILVLFMRLVAALWIVEGLMHWHTVLGIAIAGPGADGGSPMEDSSIVVFFAIIDLIASVGLWLATPWGGVIWLVGVGSQILVAVGMPNFYPYPYRWPIVAADLALVSLYMALTWQVTASGHRRLP